MTTNEKLLKQGPLAKLYNKLINGDFVSVRGLLTVELLNYTMCFDGKEDGIINIDNIFKTSKEYVEKELEWYKSQNPNNEFIKQYAQIWSTCADMNGMTNSNYGFLIFSPQNGNQYHNVLKTLKEDPCSRRAIMYYTNPWMHHQGGNDHVCTCYVSYTIRDNKLHGFVSMRSNDIRYGLIGADLAWQLYVLQALAKSLEVEVGDLHWHAVSLHLYERHFLQLMEIFKEPK